MTRRINSLRAISVQLLTAASGQRLLGIEFRAREAQSLLALVCVRLCVMALGYSKRSRCRGCGTRLPTITPATHGRPGVGEGISESPVSSGVRFCIA